MERISGDVPEGRTPSGETANMRRLWMRRVRPEIPRAGARIAALALALLSGCTVGPDFHRPEAPAVPRYTREPLPPKTASADVPGGDEQKFVENLDISHQWWTLFESPALSALIDRALHASPTLAAAQAALRQAMEQVAAQEGAFYPSLQAGFVPGYQ